MTLDGVPPGRKGVCIDWTQPSLVKSSRLQLYLSVVQRGNQVSDTNDIFILCPLEYWGVK